jgi:CHAT domain/Pentapeptide repeats (8 copies)
MKEYLDFDLEIREGGPQEYPVEVDSPGGQASGEMHFPFDDYELENKLLALENALLRSGGSQRGLSPEEQTVKEFGERLFNAVLIGDVKTRYEVSLREAFWQDKGLRLKLRIQPPKLALLPWEFLYDPDSGEYLCFSSSTPLVRYVDLRRPVEQLPVTPPLRILGMVASPIDLPQLNVEREKGLVEEAIKVLRTKGLVELTWLEDQTWSALQEAMWGGPWHIFHFVGHGDFDRNSGEGRVAFSDEMDRQEILPARHLARLLDDHRDLRLVFLNSCEGARGSEGDPFSGSAATLVRRGVPAVLAMQYQITDKAAIAFSRAFYHAVANNLPVDAAVAAARTAVSINDTLEWGTPVFYMRSPDGHLFDIKKDEREEGEPLRRYRENVQTLWTNGELHEYNADRLKSIADNELRLTPSTAADIEREVMGETKEAIIERQEVAAREEERKHAILDEYEDWISQRIDAGLDRDPDEYAPIRVSARWRTQRVLERLDRDHKKDLLEFLWEQQLIRREEGIVDGRKREAHVVGLSGADLREANLRYIILEGAALNGAILENADLRDAKLSGTNLGGAYLSGADLRGANMSKTSLREAQLQRKDELNLRGADLTDADLSGADLTGANITEEQLATCKSLAGATIPDGSIHD